MTKNLTSISILLRLHVMVMNIFGKFGLSGWSKRTCMCTTATAILILILYSFSLTCCVLISSGLKKALRKGSSIIIFNPETDIHQDVQDSRVIHMDMSQTVLQYYTRNGDVISNVIEVNHKLNSEETSQYDLEYNGKDNAGLKPHVYDDYSDEERKYFDKHQIQDKVDIPAELIDRQDGVQKLPQALIIGVKKGGTRALLEFLRVHPDIRGPGPEIHFFDKFYHKGLEWYRSRMPATLEDQMTVEKTPSYFVTHGVPERVFNMSRNLKLLIVVRDPVTRAISDYTQAVSKRGVEVKPFEEMVFLETSKTGKEFPSCSHCGLVDTRWGAIRIGQYARHLERWMEYFPIEQIHFINGENLVINPADELNKVQDFLGLKRVITEKHFYFNSTKGFPCLKKPESSGNPHCLGKTKGRQHPDIDPKVIKRLKDFYRPFNAKFYQITGQIFGWD